MYKCYTFFLFWKCLDVMSYDTISYRTSTPADNKLHFFHNFVDTNYRLILVWAKWPCKLVCATWNVVNCNKLQINISLYTLCYGYVGYVMNSKCNT